MTVFLVTVSIFYIIFYIAWIGALVAALLYQFSWFYYIWAILLGVKGALGLSLVIKHWKLFPKFRKVKKKTSDSDLNNPKIINTVVIVRNNASYKFIAFIIIELMEALWLSLLWLYILLRDIDGAQLESFTNVYGLMPLLNLPLKVQFLYFCLVYIKHE